MKNKGIYFSLETTITLSLIIMVLIAPVQKNSTDLEKLILTQKMHDLLLAWASEKNFSANEMKEDFEFAFGQKSAIIAAGEEKIEIRTQNKIFQEKIAETINVLDQNFEYKKISLTVFN